MKKKFLIYTILLVVMFFIRCTKTDKPSQVTQPPPDTTRTVIVPMDTTLLPGDMLIRVMEFQTNIPVSNALFIRSSCNTIGDTGCINPHSVGYWYSDSKGNIYIRRSDSLGSPKTGELEFDAFRRANYWARDGFDSLTVTDSVKRAVIKLIPYAWLKIHLKNEVHYSLPTTLTMLYDVADIFPVYPDPSNALARYHLTQYSINNLDTTFYIKTYANSSNEILVEHDTTDSELNTYERGLYHGTQVATKFDTLDWEIILK